MKKYIDADRLLMEAKALSGPMTGDGWDNWGVFALIERQPAADVVEVVRCKDCKHFEQAECPWDELFVINVNGYCSKGQRKEGEE